MEKKIESQSKEIHYLNERLAILLSKRYRAQSEQLKHIQGQLFDEAELEQAIADTLQAIEEHNTSAAETRVPQLPKKPRTKLRQSLSEKSYLSTCVE
jgi:hypothetical protein